MRDVRHPTGAFVLFARAHHLGPWRIPGCQAPEYRLTVYGISEVGDGWFARTSVYAKRRSPRPSRSASGCVPTVAPIHVCFASWRAASKIGEKAGAGEEKITRGASNLCPNTTIHREWKGMITGSAPTDNGEVTHRNWLDRWGCEV